MATGTAIGTGCPPMDASDRTPSLEPALLSGVVQTCDPDRIDRAAARAGLPVNDRLREVLGRITPGLKAELKARGLCVGDPIFVRIFKIERRLELWMQRGDRYVRFKDYPICAFSGTPGPKRQEGDQQAPEGFYQVGPAQMNPESTFHLSFNLGYPNAFEQAQGWTGSALMVHGSCVSIGCYAMTNAGIDQIYALGHYALLLGQDRFPVHAFPFELTSEKLFAYRTEPWIEFWRQLEPGFTFFEAHRVPPQVGVDKGRYSIVQVSGRPVPSDAAHPRPR